MSLEQDVRDLNASIRELIAVMRNGAGAHAPVQFNDNLEPVPLLRQEEDDGRPAFEIKERPLSYAEDIQQPALALIKAKGRDALAGILARFGAKTAKDVPTERWPELAAAIVEAAG
jgi:hypothetical protein